MENLNFKVPYTKILKLEPHSNAERLEIAFVYDFQVVVQKGRYKVGDSVIYIPIDSILPEKVETLLFGPDSKVKLHHNRVRQIRLRGLASQGMIADPETLSSIVNPKYLVDEQDVANILGITKYEPPQKGAAQTQGKPNGRRAQAHPDFHAYNGLGNVKWFPSLFAEGEDIMIQEKLHGTNARAALLPFRANTLLKKIKKFFGFAPLVEKVYGSNRVDITHSSSYKGYYGEDIYGNVFAKLNVFDKLVLGETVFGEIVGPGIQKGYEYDLKEHKFVLFDVKVMQDDGSHVWMNPDDVEAFAKERGFDFVPVLYKGAYNKELTKGMSMGPSVFCPTEKVREGCCIKARQDYSKEGNKKALKWISETYLDDKTNTDEH